MMMTRWLLIDDDVDFLLLLKRGLEDRGFEVQTAQTLAEAESCLASQSFDVVTLDLNLNHVSGLSFIQRLSALVPKPMILVVTGFASLSTAVEAAKLGAFDVVAKPVTVSRILEKLSDTSAFSSVPHASLHVQEWEMMQDTLKACDYNISVAAERLGISRRTLQRKLKKSPFGPVSKR